MAQMNDYQIRILPPVEQITLLSNELSKLWKEWDKESKYGSHVDCYVWWHLNGSRISQIQSRVNKLRIVHNIPCLGKRRGRHKVFYPFHES